MMKQHRKWSMWTFMMIMLPLAAYSQDVDIDEADLVGRWTQTESEGEFVGRLYGEGVDYYVQKPDVISFYAENNTLGDDSLGVAYYYLPNYPERDPQTWQYTGNYVGKWVYLGIQDYFISKNNILHLQLRGGHHCQRYRITAFDGESMTLALLNGLGSIKLVRENTTDVLAPRRDDDAEAPYYNIDGRQLPTEPSSGVFIKNKKKYIKETK